MPKTVHLKADAVGANNGTSWADAFVDQADAIADLQAGDTLLTDGVIYGGLPQINNLDDITILGKAGPSRFTRLMGVLPQVIGDITDEGGGVFSIAAASTPPTVTWDYRQDDAMGSVTGVSTLRIDILRLYVGLPMALPTVAAWYGHLPRNSTFATTSPAEGFWGYTGGRVYVNPPGSPSLAEVASKLGIGTLDRGIYCSNFENLRVADIEAVGFGNPNTQQGAFYFINWTGLRVSDCVSYDAGYRSFNFEGDNGSTDPMGLVASRCVAAGDCIVGATQNNPFVIYNQSGTTDGGVIRDSAIIAYPWLDPDGRPILGSTSGQTAMNQAYKPTGFYSHSAGAGATSMDGIVLERFSMLSMCQPLNAKHNATAALGMFWPNERIASILNVETPAFDRTDPDDYPVQVRGGVVYGSIGNHGNVALRGVRAVIPEAMGGLSDYEYDAGGPVTNQEWVAFPESLAALYYEACELFFRKKATARGIWFASAASNRFYMDLCTVVFDVPTVAFDQDPFIYHTAGSSGNPGTTLRLRGNVFVHHGPANSNRMFLKRNGAFTASADYDIEIFGNWEFEANWWFGVDAGNNFNRGGATGGFKGLTYAECADNAGGSPLNALGLFTQGTDPQFVDIASGDLRPSPGGNLATTPMPAPYAAIQHLVGIAGGSFDERYGAFQGGHAVGNFVTTGYAI